MSDWREASETEVFVSYSRADQKQAMQVIKLLQDAGLNVWWDGELKPGSQYLDSTEEALESAKAVVVLWTQTSIASNWVRDEAMSGRDRNCLVPVSLDGSMAPLGFRQIQAIDFSGWKGKAQEPVAGQLLQAVADLRGRAIPPIEHAPRFPGISRRNALLAGGGALAALGGWTLWKFDAFAPAAATNSIAVLPFRNLSGDETQDYFSAGLAEELRVTLSLNPQLLVAAETSSRIFEESNEGLEAIAERLGVAFVLEGSVRRSADLLRITARLVDVTTGFDAWSQVFERPPDNTLELHRELATSVVDALFAADDLDVAITQRPGGTDSSEALDHYLQGLSLFRLAASEETDREALREFERAIAIDPAYAVGHATYGWALMIVGATYTAGEELSDYKRRAAVAARRAIELAPNAPEGHAALGLILLNSLDLRGAREPYQTSFDLGFGNAQILGAFAQFSAYLTEFDDAKTSIARAQRLDPLNAQVYRTSAFVHYLARELDGAKSAANQALVLNEDISTVHASLGDIAFLDGDFEAAREHFRSEPYALERLRGLAMVEDRLEGREAARARLDEMITSHGENSIYQQAQVLAVWGENEAALDALETGLENSDPGVAICGAEPLFDPIRQDPRFAAILGRLGLEA
ncbi:TIR domain-containing protein [Aurantiacibacter sp. MUD11]|uniref:TIR domain-containing protein n=1 Tax=Aurantiacibacter sp. MUD11 TaxID=3003265 RepID=UPI0022AA370B|nr:TIR domain-containing protein [Aurantiacibacter sp. MUD11]WAT17009.1 TIR domain-containing protein [Aurantiacibacter sp. MUD11]